VAEVLNNTEEGGASSPCYYDDWDVHTWPHSFEKNVAERLEDRVRDEKYRKGNAVLGSGDVDIGFETFDFGITNICTIEERGEVKNA